MKKTAFILFIIFFCVTAYSQRPQFSLSTDAGILRSFRENQRFWAFGQTVTAHFHFTPKDGMYAWLGYYTNGKFNNNATATAKTVFTTPMEINYVNRALLGLRHISIGWQHYFQGRYNNEDNWNLYGYAGFGLLFGSVENTHSIAIDSTDYYIPVLPGKASFKRLTYDLGVGFERPLGGDILLYMEGKAIIPAIGYPSRHLFVNDKAPFAASVNLGLRLLFDY